MKNLLIILSLFISQSLFSQNTSDLLKYKIPFFEIDSIVEAKLILGAEVYCLESKAVSLSAIDLSRFPPPQILIKSWRSYYGAVIHREGKKIRGKPNLPKSQIFKEFGIKEGTEASKSQIYGLADCSDNDAIRDRRQKQSVYYINCLCEVEEENIMFDFEIFKYFK